MAPQLRPRRDERAASLVEYALLIAVFAMVVLGGIDALQSSASAAFRAQAADLSDGPVRPPSSSVPSSSTTTSTTTTTTVSSTTTTTTPRTTTTTTSTTTTTVPRATTATAAWGAPSSVRSGSSWTAGATLTVTDDLGRPVSGATATVRTETRTSSGSWREVGRTTGSTGSAGTLGLSTSGLARNGQSAVGSVRYTLVSLTPGSLRWSGGSISVTVSAP